MCEREREFCELLIFRSSWKWKDVGIVPLKELNGATLSKTWFFELLPPRYFAFYILVLNSSYPAN